MAGHTHLRKWGVIMAGTMKNVAKKAMDKSGNVAKTVTGSDDGKSIFFLILAFGCMYLILDVFYGNNKLKSLADTIFGVSSGTGTQNPFSEDFAATKESESYSQIDNKDYRDQIDKYYEKMLEKGYENLSKSQQKEIDQWRNDKEKYNPDATNDFGGGGGSH